MNEPDEFVKAFDEMLVFLFVSVTEASGTTAPVWSVVVPLTVAVLAWGQALGAVNKGASMKNKGPAKVRKLSTIDPLNQSF
jgi:hypothetical protein